MKKILLTALSLLTLSACTPRTAQVAETVVTTGGAAAVFLNRPHLSLKALVVTVHNPTTTPLTGDPTRNMRAVITVGGEHVAPAPGTACTRATSAELRWNCPIPTVPGGGAWPLAFQSDGTGAPSITFAFGTGYLGSPVLVPIPLAR